MSMIIKLFNKTNLSVAEPQSLTEIVSVCGGQVFLVQEPLLELENLMVRKSSSTFPLFLWRLSTVEKA